MFYAIVVFHLFPLLLRGSAEELVESLLLNVAGYFTVYLPLLESAFFPTALISLYGVIASTLVLKAGVQLTTGVYMLLSKLSIILKPSYTIMCSEWGTCG